jgi:phosphate transport system substrate-binding protein
VRRLPGGIGYVELAYAVQNRLTFAALKNPSGRFVTPSVATSAAAASAAASAMKRDARVSIVNSRGANAYPIVGFTYVLAYSNMPAAKAAELKRFLNWAMHQGQKMAAPLYYVPLPASIVAINLRTIKAIQ